MKEGYEHQIGRFFAIFLILTHMSYCIFILNKCEYMLYLLPSIYLTWFFGHEHIFGLVLAWSQVIILPSTFLDKRFIVPFIISAMFIYCARDTNQKDKQPYRDEECIENTPLTGPPQKQNEPYVDDLSILLGDEVSEIEDLERKYMNNS